MTVSREVRPLGFDLARFGTAPAIVHDGGTLTYADLDGLVRDRAAQLGSTRRLVLVEGAHELEPLVTSLAALNRRREPVISPGLLSRIILFRPTGRPGAPSVRRRHTREFTSGDSRARESMRSRT